MKCFTHIELSLTEIHVLPDDVEFFFFSVFFFAYSKLPQPPRNRYRLTLNFRFQNILVYIKLYIFKSKYFATASLQSPRISNHAGLQICKRNVKMKELS